MRLQHALFIAFSSAVRENVYADENGFLTKSGRDLYKGYVDERLTLRKNIDVLARRVEIYIDWASDLRRDPSTVTPGLDPLSSSSILGAYDFDCDKHMPRQNVSEIPFKDHPERPALHVDWNSAKHHVFSFFYCFERTHEIDQSGAAVGVRQRNRSAGTRQAHPVADRRHEEMARGRR